MSTLELTKNWWRRVVANDQALSLWIQKLQVTEIGGHNDHFEFMEQNTVPIREARILTNIALDEEKHSNLLLDLMESRGIQRRYIDDEGMQSFYWRKMNEQVNSLESYCAVNYFGESLAADRFSILHEMPETPSDIREFISKALPDEIFHRETLMRLAGEETMARLRPVHEETLAKLLHKA